MYDNSQTGQSFFLSNILSVMLGIGSFLAANIDKTLGYVVALVTIGFTLDRWFCFRKTRKKDTYKPYSKNKKNEKS